MSDNRTNRISGLMLKPLELPTPLLVLFLVAATFAQVWFNSRFGVLLVMSGVVLAFCVPTKTGGQGFWTFKTHTVWGVPLLIFIGAGAGVVITLVTFIIKMTILVLFALIVLFVVFKAWRNSDKLASALNTVRSFGRS